MAVYSVHVEMTPSKGFKVTVPALPGCRFMAATFERRSIARRGKSKIV